ncbi:MAG: hypothetical protein IJ793_00245 [Opitutales bacterium]|nr:hypothetical protein [Opitutales bacterium]
MKSARLCISVSPELYDWVRSQARKRKTSVSRYVRGWMEDTMETTDEEVKPYPIEEVIAESKQAEMDLREGRLQEFDSAEEMLEFLHNDSL